MYCPYCRTVLPEGSKFCSSCGKTMPAAPAGAPPGPVPAAEAQPPHTGATVTGAPRPISDELVDAPPLERIPTARPPVPSPRTEWPAETAVLPEPDSGSRTPLIAAMLLALLLLIGIGLWLLGRSRSAPSVATVPINPVPRGPSVVQSPAPAPGPPVTAQPAKPQGMPDDIRRYLSFLQGVEAQRKAYEGQLTNKMLAVVPSLLMPNFDSDNVRPPDQQVIGQFRQLAQEYTQATIRFQAAAQQVGVPAACRKLHADYSTALSMNPRTIQQAADSIASGNYSGLLSMRSSVGKNIEDYYRAADQELANICNQYNVRKSFDIGNSSGGGDILLP
jgi:hypothetical protein